MTGLQGLVKATTSLGWLREKNIPVIGCRGTGRVCWSLSGDYWLASRAEKRIVDSLIHREFGVRIGLEERLVVLHRVELRGSEYAVEVFAEATRLGILEHAPPRGWVLHPSASLASLALSYGAEAVELRGLAPGNLKGKKIRVGTSNARGRWAILDLGQYVAVARVVDNHTVRVKDVASKTLKTLEPGTMDDVVEANEEIHGGLASEARHFIRRALAGHARGGRVAVALGGDDSSAALLSIAREAVGNDRVVAIHVASELVFPETTRYAEKLASILDIELHITNAPSPLEAIAEKGLMNKNDKWCRTLLRVEPLLKAASQLGVNIVLEGTRKWGSKARRLGKYPGPSRVVRALPLYHWPRLALQLYLYERSIPINQLYQEGITRVNCIICPDMSVHELHKAYSLHRGFFRRLARVVVARSQGRKTEQQAMAWILSGSWRHG